MIYFILGIAILLFIVSFIVFSKAHSTQIKKRIEQEQYQKLLGDYVLKQAAIEKAKVQLEEIENKIKKVRQQADQIYNKEKQGISNRLNEFKKVSEQSACLFVENLQTQYKHAEAVHAQKMTSLKDAMDRAAAELNNLKETRKAAYEAALKEEQIRQNKDNYRLLPSKLELQDIYTLENIKKGLHKPRILSMLIWQTFWQPLAKEKFPIILQSKTKIGIYKITNIRTEECYIGQSLDIYKRWCQHCKAGLGIDTPVGNKLYKAIQKDGLENFTFELLIECEKELLNEKEKYFIELYQSDTFGYNGTGGNKK